MRRTTKYFLISLFASASVCFAQSGLKLELSRSFTSPAEGPKLKGYTGSVYFKSSKNLSFSVSSGFSEMEQSANYLRDYKNSNMNYGKAGNLKIIPFIFGTQYIIKRAYNLEYVLEAETGLNLLRFNLSANGNKSTRHELHFGIGAAGGINYSITHFLQFVVKAKFNIVSKIGNQEIFDKRTRYVSVLTGLKVAV